MSESKSFEELFLNFNEDSHFDVKELKILVIGNINSNTMYLERIKEWQLKENIFFDIVLSVGNFTSSEDDNLSIKEKICRKEAKIESMISFIENLCIPLVYFGGRNDPESLFSENPPTFTIKSKNCHNNFYKLADDLYVIGQGGSLKDQSNAFEYYNNIYIDFEDTKRKILKMNTTPNIKFIYLSFEEISTLMNFKTSYTVINNASFNEEKNFLINIHQNLQKEGIEEFNGIKLINSGELNKGNFVILNLCRDKENENIWMLKNAEFHKL